jgi:LacI family transcriptional regulator
MLQNIELVVNSAGFNMIIQYFYETQSVEEQLNVIRRSGTSGIIILATEMSSYNASTFKALNIPIVVLDNNAYNIETDNVCINNIQGAYAAVSYLILKGHRDIGYIGVTSRINNFDMRFMGANQAMRTHTKRPFTTDSRLEVKLGSEDAYRDILRYIQRNHGRRLPTAFFAENDYIAAECVRAFQAYGYRIPDDISIIGFDDTPIAGLTEPKLTTMRVNQEEMARIAVKRLLEQIEHATHNSLLIAVSAELIVRESVAAPRERS